MWESLWRRFFRATKPGIQETGPLILSNFGKEGITMSTDARAITIHETIHPDWETVKEWAKATFTKERMTEVGLATATVVSLRDVLEIGRGFRTPNGFPIPRTPGFAWMQERRLSSQNFDYYKEYRITLQESQLPLSSYPRNYHPFQDHGQGTWL